MQQLTSDASGDITQDFSTIPGQIYRILVRSQPAAFFGGPVADGTIAIYHVDSNLTYGVVPVSDTDGTIFSITTTGLDLIQERTILAHTNTLRLIGDELGDTKNFIVALTPVR